MRCAWTGGEPVLLRYDGFSWVAPDEMEAYALPVAQKRIAALAAAHLASAAG